MEPMSISDYARHRKAMGLSGGSRQAVHRAINLKWIKKRPDGKIDAVEADHAWEANCPRRRKGQKTAQQAHGTTGWEVAPDGGESHDAARTRKERALADKAELDAEVRAGQLIRLDTVETVLHKIGLIVRGRLEGMSDRAAARLVSVNTLHEARVILDEEVNGTLRALADELDAAHTEIAPDTDSGS